MLRIRFQSGSIGCRRNHDGNASASGGDMVKTPSDGSISVSSRHGFERGFRHGFAANCWMRRRIAVKCRPRIAEESSMWWGVQKEPYILPPKHAAVFRLGA